MMKSIDDDFKTTVKFDKLIKKYKNCTERRSIFQRINKAIKQNSSQVSESNNSQFMNGDTKSKFISSHE